MSEGKDGYNMLEGPVLFKSEIHRTELYKYQETFLKTTKQKLVEII